MWCFKEASRILIMECPSVFDDTTGIINQSIRKAASVSKELRFGVTAVSEMWVEDAAAPVQRSMNESLVAVVGNWASMLCKSARALVDAIPEHKPFVLETFDETRIRAQVLAHTWDQFAKECGAASEVDEFRWRCHAGCRFAPP